MRSIRAWFLLLCGLLAGLGLGAGASGAADHTPPAPDTTATLPVHDATGLHLGDLHITLRGRWQPITPAVPAGTRTLGPLLTAALAPVDYDTRPRTGTGGGFFGVFSQGSWPEPGPEETFAHAALVLHHQGHHPLPASREAVTVSAVDTAGRQFAPVAATPLFLPCEDMNPGTRLTCHVSFVLPADTALASVAVVFPPTVALPAPTPAESWEEPAS